MPEWELHFWKVDPTYVPAGLWRQPCALFTFQNGIRPMYWVVEEDWLKAGQPRQITIEWDLS